jgi:RimJ/RimL family protein N-acetyltransferase
VLGVIVDSCVPQVNGKHQPDGGHSLMNGSIEVRPFAGRREYEQMVDYFLDADDEFLHAMGVARSRLPSREDWISSALRDHDRPIHEKERAYLAWVYGGVAIGHSSINRIEVGEAAFIHLHLWLRMHRQAGLGTTFFQLSVGHFTQDFSLKRLYCEPCADNPGPNRVLLKSEFRLIKRYRTVPGPINFEQDVNQYVRHFSAPSNG